MGIEGIISQQFFWCFWASQTLYNGRTLEPELQTQFEYFWIALMPPPPIRTEHFIYFAEFSPNSSLAGISYPQYSLYSKKWLVGDK